MYDPILCAEVLKVSSFSSNDKISSLRKVFYNTKSAALNAGFSLPKTNIRTKAGTIDGIRRIADMAVVNSIPQLPW